MTWNWYRDTRRLGWTAWGRDTSFVSRPGAGPWLGDLKFRVAGGLGKNRSRDTLLVSQHGWQCGRSRPGF